jgi:hypothetical protein
LAQRSISRYPPADEALRWFTSLSPVERGKFMAGLAHNLTIAGRCFLNAFAPEQSDTPRARQINELLHGVTDYLSDPHGGKVSDASAVSVIKRLLEQPDAAVGLQVAQAWHYATEAIK